MWMRAADAKDTQAMAIWCGERGSGEKTKEGFARDERVMQKALIQSGIWYDQRLGTPTFHYMRAKRMLARQFVYPDPQCCLEEQALAIDHDDKSARHLKQACPQESKPFEGRARSGIKCMAGVQCRQTCIFDDWRRAYLS